MRNERIGKWYAEGYQDALAELAEILERDGVDEMIKYLKANRRGA